MGTHFELEIQNGGHLKEIGKKGGGEGKGRESAEGEEVEMSFEEGSITSIELLLVLKSRTLPRFLSLLFFPFDHLLPF